MTGRKSYMDLLSVLSCVAVVYLHCSNIVFANVGDLQWILAVIIQSIFPFAVPVFFMISGAKLIGYRERYDTKTFLAKRFKRILIPLFGFNAFCYLAGFCPRPSTRGGSSALLPLLKAS